jgi:tRNA(Ile)-lysidine synthase
VRGAAHPLRLRHRVLDAVRRQGLWAPDEAVTVAVSGGADSVALLGLLVATAGAHRGRLQVATVDHGARDGSAADADFVEALAADLGLPFVRFTLALGPGASEARLRDARREALGSLGTLVALGHHLDDQAETVMLQLLRGAGSHGLAAMAPRNGPWVRPLLGLTRAELRGWLTHRGLTFREDPTNTSPRYLRNRVRAELMPLLEDLRPGAAGALARAAGHLAQDDAWLSALAGEVPGPPFEREALDALPPPVLRRVLLRLSDRPESGWVEAAVTGLRDGAPRVGLPGGRVLKIRRRDVIRDDDPLGPRGDGPPRRG